MDSFKMKSKQSEKELQAFLPQLEGLSLRTLETNQKQNQWEHICYGKPDSVSSLKVEHSLLKQLLLPRSTILGTKVILLLI